MQINAQYFQETKFYMVRTENVRKDKAENEAAKVSNVGQWKPFVKN